MRVVRSVDGFGLKREFLFSKGVYIPYITKAYFGMTNPPVSLKHFAIGGMCLPEKLVLLTRR